ncbi:transmembrane protein 92-like [Mesocricetus auratus]|uniref:Transmembrane protein 92-like n=1 Tax=Mesocricetus auratus TaxID=10036 RepID=A0ABM2WYE5_MESAU|nr:transmembrane protein 92-like [Mesocricetus auratus]
MGFRCCESGCCLEKKNIGNTSNHSLRMVSIIFLVMIPLNMFIYRLVKCFCCKCREPEENLRRNHQIPPEAPTIAPVEMIWVTPLDPPPPYVEVILNLEEPPPPYSFWPEDPAGQMRCTYTSAF